MSLFAQQLNAIAASQPASKPARVESVATERARKVGEANRNAIMDALKSAGEPMRTREIAAATGISWELVRKWAVRMADSGQIARSGEYGETRYAVKK